MAGLRLIEEIVALCPHRYNVVLVGKEPHAPYNRVLLSIAFPGARFHCIGTVQRVARGDDFCTYAALRFDFRDDEERQLAERVERLDPPSPGDHTV